MAAEIIVRVVEFGKFAKTAKDNRRFYQMQFRDPNTGRKVTRSTGIERTGRKSDRSAAQQAAGKWQAELREGRYHAPGKITWQDFREKYEREVLASLAQATDENVSGVFNSIENILNPAKLRDLTAPRLSQWQAKLRENGLAESTIAGMSAHLRSVFTWAVKMGYAATAPTIEKPKRAKRARGAKKIKVMKGRAITGEEFERLLSKVSAVVGETAAPSWTHYLQGLWTSGLRLAESLVLTWDTGDPMSVDFSDKYPMLRIAAESEKGFQDRLLPMAPEFAEFLQRTPEADRVGPVFKLVTRLGRPPREWWVSSVVSKIGKAAGVKVNTDRRTGKIKFASAHDLRRSFGTRWSSRIMPPALMELMRHESIETTLAYYVEKNAERTAGELWAAHKLAGNTSGNTNPIEAVESEIAKTAKQGRKRR